MQYQPISVKSTKKPLKWKGWEGGTNLQSQKDTRQKTTESIPEETNLQSQKDPRQKTTDEKTENSQKSGLNPPKQ